MKMSRLFSRNNIIITAALAGVFAIAPGGAVGEKREPIVVTSLSMQAERLGNVVTFLGDVVLKKEEITLYSDTVVVFYDEGAKTIREIEARGNVVVRRDDRVAFANHASYYTKEEKIVLTGGARIIENENELGGDRITLFVREDRSIVEGGRVLFYQEKRQEKKGE